MAQALVTLVNGGMLASASGAPPRTQSPAGGSESDGHLRTFQIALRAAFAQVKVREPERISFHIPDPRLGVVKLSGLYRVSEGSDTLVLILHGLASCAESLQCSEAADGVDSAGCSSLRLSMRGADLSGEDIYHAGQARNRPPSSNGTENRVKASLAHAPLAVRAGTGAASDATGRCGISPAIDL